MTPSKTRVGLLTFSDGRKYIHEDLLEVNWRYQKEVVAALERTGEVEVVAGRDIVWTPELARNEATRLTQEGCQLTIFNYAIWAFPHLTAIASKFAPGPFLLFCNLNPSEPGMVAMLSAAGTMDQLGLPYLRVWGSIQEPMVLRQVLSFVRAAGALARLKGQTYGLFWGGDRWVCTPP